MKEIRSRFRSLSLILESIITLGSIAIVPLILMSAAPSSDMLASRTGEDEVGSTGIVPPFTSVALQAALLIGEEESLAAPSDESANPQKSEGPSKTLSAALIA